MLTNAFSISDFVSLQEYYNKVLIVQARDSKVGEETILYLQDKYFIILQLNLIDKGWQYRLQINLFNLSYVLASLYTK